MTENRYIERFLVYFFSSVFFSILSFLVIMLIFQALPFLGPLSWIFLLNFAGLHTFIYFKLWGRPKFTILSSILSAFFTISLGLILAYTIQAWLYFGPIAIVYGFVTGLFKKPDVKKKIKKKVKIQDSIKSLAFTSLRLIIFLSILTGAFIVADNGGFRTCPYTDEYVQVPSELENAEMTLTRDIAVFDHQADYHCSPLVQTIDRRLETIHRSTGQTIPAGTSFRLDRVLAISKHGMAAVDSGSGPLHYLVLLDDDGRSYLIHTTDLDYNPSPNTTGPNDEPYFSYIKDGEVIDFPTWSYFREYYTDK